MKLLIAIAALLASVSASAGELDGKGIICHPEKSITGQPTWYWFTGGSVVESDIEVNGTEAKVIRPELGEYWTNPTTVRWGSRTLRYELDRRTLVHKVVMRDEEMWISQCEVAESYEAYTNSIAAFLRREQDFIDEMTKDNKI